MFNILILIKRYKVKFLIIITIIVFTIGINYISTFNSSFFKENLLKIDYQKLYKVLSVIDGDTFNIKVEGKIVKVRMLGIDTPETIDPRKKVQCFGKEASDKTKELLLKHFVILKIDPTQSIYDKYGRLLAYVYREDNLFINEYLLENGYAHEYTYNIPYKMQKDFKELQKKAREEKLGLWGLLCLQK